MSSGFNPLQIPPGVVSLPTKAMRSTNWCEVNAIRWRAGELMPIGGQEKINYSFASPCRKIHSWYDLAGTALYVAYLCEQHAYVDVGGELIDITPVDGLSAIGRVSDGYGMGDYGLGDYGKPPRVNPGAEALLSVLPDAFSLDNFGAVLYAMTSADGRLLQWDPAAYRSDPTVVLTAQENAPTGRCFVVTPERFIMIFGMTNTGGTGRRFGWCGQEDPSDWDFASLTSTAGFYDIEPGSPIVAATAGRSQWVAFWTIKKAYVSRYVGLPYVYDYEELADGCTPWSPQSAAMTTSLLIWVTEQGPMSFDGTAVAPIPCPVRSWINDDIDEFNARFQAAAAHLGDYNEFWWLFPQAGANHNTRAVIYNYLEGWWSQVRMSRSAGLNSSYASSAIFADGTQPYRHENGEIFNGCDLPWCETFPMQLASGARLATLKQALVDFKGDETSVAYQLFYKQNRLSSTPESVTPPIDIRTNGYVDFRTTGRDIRLRFTCKGPRVPQFTLGQHLIDVVARGDR